jgi:hypothetical protein
MEKKIHCHIQKYDIFKWILFAISNFAIIEEITSVKSVIIIGSSAQKNIRRHKKIYAARKTYVTYICTALLFSLA